MPISRRAILAAIAAETAERGGPMPSWLVPVACNARTQGDKLSVDTHLIELRQENCIALDRAESGHSRIELTTEGRRELEALKAKREQSAQRPAPSAQEPPAPEPLPPFDDTVAPATFSPPPSERTTPPTLTPIDPEAQPGLYVLLCGCAEIVAANITEAMEEGDLAEMDRLQRLGAALLQATRRDA